MLVALYPAGTSENSHICLISFYHQRTKPTIQQSKNKGGIQKKSFSVHDAKLSI